MHRAFLSSTYQQYLLARNSKSSIGPNILSYLSYDLCDEQESAINFEIPLVGLQVIHDLRSLLNCMNAWITEMHKWEAWLRIIDDYSEDERWELRLEFVDPIAHRCLLEPSAMCDRILSALYFLLHHAKLSLDSSYKDELATDAAAKKALRAGKEHTRYMQRRELGEEIDHLSESWKTAQAVCEKTKLLDSETLREATLNYRNAASHSIAPNFEFGVLPYVKRQLRFAEFMTPNDDGTVTFKKDRSRTAISYGFGEHSPLQHLETFQLIRMQVKLAKDAMRAYETLLREVIARIRAKRCGDQRGPA